MTDHINSHFQKAHLLQPHDRQELARLLPGTLGPDAAIEAARACEADRRWNDHKAGGRPAVAAFAAVEEARTRPARRHKA